VSGHNDPRVAALVLYDGHAGDLPQPDVLDACATHVGVARRGAAQYVAFHSKEGGEQTLLVVALITFHHNKGGRLLMAIGI
jgi:hypothetical protein